MPFARPLMPVSQSERETPALPGGVAVKFGDVVGE